MTIINPDEARVWNRLKNSEEKYRSLYHEKSRLTDSLNAQINYQKELSSKQYDLEILQQKENIALRKELISLTEERDKYKLKAKRRLKAAFLGIPIGIGLGLLIPILL